MLKSIRGIIVDSLFIIWLLVIVYFVADFGLRKGDNAKSYEAGKFDDRTSYILGLIHGAALLTILLSALLNNAQIGQIVGLPFVTWGGFAMMLAGLSVRIWAMVVLGKFYTRTLRMEPDQQIVQQGPYRLIRHPGYLGSLLFWIGAGLATRNWIVAGGIALAFGLAYRSRIQAEETMLLATFGQAYKDYSRRTWRLVPFLF
jgi:protein-S-isoprenylcysteine O-methyltransferase Ste14